MTLLTLRVLFYRAKYKLSWISSNYFHMLCSSGKTNLFVQFSYLDLKKLILALKNKEPAYIICGENAVSCGLSSATQPVI